MAASIYYNHVTQAAILAAMQEVSGGRDCRIDVGMTWLDASIAIRKADGWWQTTLIPKSIDNTKAIDPTQQMLSFMNLIPKISYIETTQDAIDFAKQFAEDHKND